MKSKELIEFQKMEKNIVKKLNSRKKIEKNKLDSYFKQLDEIVDIEINKDVKQKGG
jgi:hypothetical protein